MAISSVLAVMIIAGFATLRQSAQFTNTIERTKESVVAKRTEALATIKLSGGMDSANVTMGRLLTFTPNSSTIQVQTLYTANNLAPTAAQPVYTVPSEDTTISLDWGVKYSGAAIEQVAFTRSPVDGSLRTAVSPGGGWGTTTFQYGNFTPSGTTYTLQLTDPYGRRAVITIDVTNNSVTRTYL